MPIDSLDKRFSIMDMDEPSHSLGPLPDGSFDAADRLHLVWLYSGIAAGGAAPVGDAHVGFMQADLGRWMRVG